MAVFILSSAAGLRPSWTRWLGVNEEEACASLDALARRLHLAPEQHPLCDHFVQKMLKSISRAAVPVPGDGWDQGKSVALDHWLRLEIAAGCFLGAVEEARDSFGRVYAILSPAQQHFIDQAITCRGT